MATTSQPLPIVVGIDGSDNADHALRWATAEATRLRAPLRIVCAWEVPASAWGVPVAAYVDPAELSEGARQALATAEGRIRDELGAAAPVVQTKAAEGGASQVLLREAHDAQMLVVGSRGRGGFASLVLGSVATACAHHTEIPLIVVGADVAPGAGDVVVGVDDSVGGRHALRWAVDQAAATGAALRVVHASILMDTPPRDTPRSMVDPTPAEKLRAAFERIVADEVVGAPPELPITVTAVPLPAAEALLQESMGAALLVVGTRGRGGFLDLHLGSVSEACLHHVTCPIAIVPTPPSES